MGHAEVLEALYPLFLKYGKPHYIRSDNGSEFIARDLQAWLKKVGIKPIQIYPGSLWENGYNERFNGSLRREVLNAEWFSTIKQAQIVTVITFSRSISPVPSVLWTVPKLIVTVNFFHFFVTLLSF